MSKLPDVKPVVSKRLTESKGKRFFKKKATVALDTISKVDLNTYLKIERKKSSLRNRQ